MVYYDRILDILPWDNPNGEGLMSYEVYLKYVRQELNKFQMASVYGALFELIDQNKVVMRRR